MPDTLVDTDVPRAAVQLACRAPSLHSTQPWQWVDEGAGSIVVDDLVAAQYIGSAAHRVLWNLDGTAPQQMVGVVS